MEKENKNITEEVKQEEQKNKKSNKAIFIILCVVLFFAGIVVGNFIVNLIDNDKKVKEKDNKKDNKKDDIKNDEEENVEEDDSLISFLDYINDEKKIYIAYKDGTFTAVNDKDASDSYYLDNNILYYKNYETSEIYRKNIEDKNKESDKIDYFIYGDKFSVVNGKIYYFQTGTSNMAITYDIESKEENKMQVPMQIWYSDFTDGKIAYIWGKNEILNTTGFFKYNFETTELKKIGDYTKIIENRKSTILFENNEEGKYCLYNKVKEKELYCIDKEKLPNESIKLNVSNNHPATVQDNSIIVLSGDKILKCSNETNCDETLYTLNDEEKEAIYIDLLYYSKKLILILGYGQRCEACYTDNYKFYDIFNDKKEYDFHFKEEGSVNFPIIFFE